MEMVWFGIRLPFQPGRGKASRGAARLLVDTRAAKKVACTCPAFGDFTFPDSLALFYHPLNHLDDRVDLVFGREDAGTDSHGSTRVEGAQ